MNYSLTTDYRNHHRRDQYVKYINRIPNDYEYRRFLQDNASKIMSAEFQYLKMTNSCQVNPCIHRSATSPPSGDFNAELKRYNNVRVKGDVTDAKCENLADYKMN
jgi:hypothetical protein